MTPRIAAAFVVAGVVTLVLAADAAYVEWRTRKVESIPIGATEDQVLAVMGPPDSQSNAGFFEACGGEEKCFDWHVHDNHQYVCFGSDGRVMCRGAYALWE